MASAVCIFLLTDGAARGETAVYPRSAFGIESSLLYLLHTRQHIHTHIFHAQLALMLYTLN